MVTARYFILPESDISDRIKVKGKPELTAFSGKMRLSQIKNKGPIEKPEKIIKEPVTKVTLKDAPEEPEEESYLTELKTFYPVAKFSSGGIDYKVIRAIVPREDKSLFGKFSGKSDLCEETLLELGLEGIVDGNTEQSLINFVLDKFGVDLSGERLVGTDENGDPVYGPYIIPCRMAGE